VPKKRKTGSGRKVRKAAPKKAARRGAKRKAAGRSAKRKVAARGAKRKVAAKRPAARKRRAAPQMSRPEPPREREEAETLIPGAADDDLAEELGEESVEAATSGQTSAADNLNAEVPEETGGPFVERSGDTVFGHGNGARNPRR